MSFRLIPQRIALSEDHFLGDLINVFKFHHISFGSPADLQHLGSDIVGNGAFRSQLFRLCTAISHTAETDLSPEEMLILVARAMAGSPASDGQGTMFIPRDARSSFVAGMEAWNRDEAAAHGASPWPSDPPAGRGRDLISKEIVEAGDHVSAELSQPGLAADTQGLSSQSVQSSSSPLSSSPLHESLEHLTLSELRSYLADIELRMSRIEPHLEQITSVVGASSKLLDPELSTPIAEAGSGKRSVSAGVRREPAASSSPISASAAKMGSLARPAASFVTSDGSAQLGHEDGLRIRRLRTMIGVLAALLLVCVAATGVFAYRYFRASSVAGSPGTRALPSRSAPAAATAPPAPGPPAPQSGLQRTEMGVSSRARTTPTPVSETAKVPAAAISRTQTPVLKPSPSATPGEPASNHRALAGTPVAIPAASPPLLANIASTPARPADAAAPAPIVRLAPAAAGPVSVPSTAMMAYVLDKHVPVYPAAAQKLGVDGTVVVRAVVSKTGKVAGANAVSGPTELRSAAVQAMTAWNFKPYLVNGAPAEVVTTVDFVFRLK